MAKGLAILIAFAALFVGGFIGFFLGVFTSEAGARLISGLDMIEERAEIENPQTIDQPGFTLKYPANWKIETDSPDYDPAHYFMIDTPGGSYLEFIFEEGENPAGYEGDIVLENLDYMLSLWDGYLRGEDQQQIVSYGNIAGKGTILSGRNMGHKIAVRIFSCTKGENTMIIVEYAYEMDRGLLQPGLDLVEWSLELK